MARQRHMGRPPLPKGRRLAERITVRLNPTEYDAARKAAKASNLMLAEWIRQTVSGFLTAQKSAV